MKRLAHLDTVSNDVLQRIGRNLLLFQQGEICLKILAIAGTVVEGYVEEGYAEEIARKQEKNFQSTQKQTIGVLKERVKSEMLSGKEPEAFATLSDTHIKPRFSFSIRCNPPDREKLEQSLDEFHRERNDLVHKLLPKLAPDLPEDTANEYLDQQYAKMLPILAYIKDITHSVQDCQEQISQDFDSPEFKSWYFVYLLLLSVANNASRPDGWTELSLAASQVIHEASEEVTALKACYRQKTFKGLLLAMGVFDVAEETTPRGDKRFLYRKKPELETGIPISIGGNPS